VVPTTLTAADTHVSDYARNSPSRDEYAQALFPHTIELGKEIFIGGNIA